LSHMRLIGDRTYTAKHKIVDGVVKDETIETILDENEVAAFKKDWEEFGVQEPILNIDFLNLFLVAMIISVGVKVAFPEVNLLAIIVSTAMYTLVCAIIVIRGLIGGMSIFGFLDLVLSSDQRRHENFLQASRNFDDFLN
jgi:hypothetical protein